MRLFVAIVPPDPIPARLAGLQDRMRPSGADVKWVETANLHLTVKFLGEIAEPAVPAIGQALGSVAARFSPFDLHLSGAGAFPPRGTPRVVWVGLAEGFEHLKALHEAVDMALEPLGVARETPPFAAHATLGRVRSPRGAHDLRRAIDSLGDAEVGRMRAVTVSLMQSHLTPKGPHYAHVEDFPLTG